MKKELFDLLLKDLPKNSVKRACYIVREYRRCEAIGNFNLCAVTKEEYDEALGILLAYSFSNSYNDTVVEMWQCDGDCSRNFGILDFCPGEFQITKDPEKKLCKFFSDSSNK